MCTAFSFRHENLYFCRNLDYPHTFGEDIVTIPRHFPISFSSGEDFSTHYAIIGMAKIKDNYPLLFDGCNERGLCMAGLNFVGNFSPAPFCEGKINLALHELILYILCRCADTCEAEDMLSKINITDKQFDAETPVAALHFLVADDKRSIVFEFTRDGGKIYENKFDILTNNPPYPYHEQNMANFLHLSTSDVAGEFAYKKGITPYSGGSGGIGLPGDFSSASRFVRGAFAFSAAKRYDERRENVLQCFHILSYVSVIDGCVKSDMGFFRTQYSSVIDTHELIYYCKYYNSHKIFAAKLWGEHLEGRALLKYSPKP